jgi:archaellin
MKHLNKNKNNSIVTTTATLLTLAAIIAIVAGPTAIIINQQAEATLREGRGAAVSAAPVAVSGDNIYIAWWTNNTENGNEEVMFRASTDGGATFSDRINLSNTTDADSWRVEIAGEGDTVVVSWWETNQTSDIPVARISTDAGETFGPMLRLATNGTISSDTEGGEEAETVEEEAVGGADVAE